MFKYLVSLFSLSIGLQIINVDPYFMDEGEFIELENSDYLIQQTINNATFFLTLSSYDIPFNIFFEIFFSYPEDGDVNFLTTIGKNQLTTLDKNTIVTTYADFNGFYLKKNYHNIVIPANSFISGDKFYITNLIRNDRRTYQYTLKIKKISQKPCPQNCSSESGICMDGVCQCNNNFIDLDCSKEAIELKLDQKIDNINILGTQNFYFQQEAQLDQVEFKMGLTEIFQQPQTLVSLYYLFENFQIGVPFKLYQNYSLTQQENTISIKFNVSLLNYNSNLQRFHRLLIKIISEDKQQFFFEVSQKSTSTSDDETNKIVIYVVVSLSSFLLIVIFFYVFYKCKCRVRYLQIAPVELQEENSFYTFEFLKKYMRKFKKEKGLYEGNFECSICLEGEGKQELRLTPCCHMFHVQCFQIWLNKHSTCPNCRKQMNQKIIMQAQKDKIQEPIQSQYIRIDQVGQELQQNANYHQPLNDGNIEY
ncbi:unnamed protein product [Paramecium sonneborni]|uniref:RING-type domain-containing protein n=1 Tax=Paramecium sonneborni TaxID=65129 RepID=A0A8S1KMR3_9CILI|nr:unnamed protein product [Paramecium sonneborni]